jgi:PAS domain S-box-containing protein
LRTEEVPLARAVMFGEENSREFIVSRDDHEDRYVLADAAPVRGASGEVKAAIVVFLDVTEQKNATQALEESEKKYRDLFNSIRDAIVVADTDRTIIDCNATFSDLFGYTLDDLMGKKTVTLYEDEAEFLRMGEAIRAHRDNLSDFLMTVRYRKKDGSVFPGETSVFYFHDSREEVTGFIGLIRDKTPHTDREGTLSRVEERVAD